MNKSEIKTDIIIDTKDIQRIIRDYYEHLLYINEDKNLEEMDKFIDTFNLNKIES